MIYLHEGTHGYIMSTYLQPPPTLKSNDGCHETYYEYHSARGPLPPPLVSYLK